MYENPIARELAYANDLAALELEIDFRPMNEEDVVAEIEKLKRKYGRC